MLKIDPEFQGKIPPLTEAEFTQLEENILADGEVYEPIVIWNGVIVDGHNRWKIVQEHPEIPYKTREMDFPDKWAAFEWMYKKQLGRRNLTEENRMYCIGKMYEARKRAQGGTGANRYTNKKEQRYQNGTTVKGTRSREQIAEELGIGVNTVVRAEKYVQGVDAMREIDPEFADDVLAGKVNITKGEVQSFAKAEPEQIKKAVQEVKEGKRTKYFLPHDIKKQYDGGEPPEPQIPSDPNWKPEYTFDDMAEEMEGIIYTFVKQLSRVIEENQGLIDGHQDRIVGAIDIIITKLNKIKEDI